MNVGANPETYKTVSPKRVAVCLAAVVAIIAVFHLVVPVPLSIGQSLSDGYSGNPGRIAKHYLDAGYSFKDPIVQIGIAYNFEYWNSSQWMGFLISEIPILAICALIMRFGLKKFDTPKSLEVRQAQTKYRLTNQGAVARDGKSSSHLTDNHKLILNAFGDKSEIPFWLLAKKTNLGTADLGLCLWGLINKGLISEKSSC